MSKNDKRVVHEKESGNQFRPSPRTNDYASIVLNEERLGSSTKVGRQSGTESSSLRIAIPKTVTPIAIDDSPFK